MKVILDIKDNRWDFFRELVSDLGFIKVVSEINDSDKGKAIQELAEALGNVQSFEQGKMDLKDASDFLDEL